MQTPLTSEELCNMEELLGVDAMARLRSWYHTAQTAGNIERETKRELEIVIKGAIEDVINMHPEHIIIEVEGRGGD